MGLCMGSMLTTETTKGDKERIACLKKEYCKGYMVLLVEMKCSE